MNQEQSNARLIRMSRQIADFFRSYPQEKATGAVADHINRFWTPRMRAEFVELARISPSAIDPLVACSLPAIRTGDRSSPD
jgi:formate dehydrogenase subunit delta